MINLDNKDIEDIYYGDKEVEAVYLGEELVWQNDPNYNIHIKGNFISSATDTNRYVYINGNQVFLPVNFDYKSRKIWEHGLSMSTSINRENNWFPSSLENLTLAEGIDNMKTFQWMFFNLKNLKSVNASDWDVSSIKEMNYMFRACAALTTITGLEKWNTENVEDFNCMFYGCSSLTGSLDLTKWDVKNATRLSNLFVMCSKLTNINLANWDTSKVTAANTMFSQCSALTTINLSNWDLRSCTNLSYMVVSCTKLTTIIGPIYNISTNLDVSPAPLTVESAMVLINGLKDGVSGQTLSFKKATYDSLTPEQLAIATAKGWTITS